jgi:hypothetical protein
MEHALLYPRREAMMAEMNEQIGNELPTTGSANPLERAINQEQGAIGYIVMWLLGVPASILFLIFLLRGCN